MSDVLLAAVLKPVTDVRSYTKIGRTLRAAGFKVHIAGYRAAAYPDEDEIQFYPLYGFARTSPKRLLAGLKLWRLLRRLRPKICIVQAIELLPWLWLYRCFFRVFLVYDVQENYRLNLTHQPHYPRLGILKAIVVGLEHWSRHFVDHYLLAERSYQTELPFPPSRTTILENKAQAPAPQPRPPRPVRYLLLTGTFNRHYGTYEGIRLAERLHAHDSRYRLIVCGMCSDTAYRNRLKDALERLTMLTYCQLSAMPVPHTDIQHQLQRADMLLLPYQTNPSTARCMPTKVFEALAQHLPMLLRPNPYWKAALAGYPAAVFWDFDKKNVEELHQNIQNTHFYRSLPQPEAYLWSGERLLTALENATPRHTLK